MLWMLLAAGLLTTLALLAVIAWHEVKYLILSEEDLG